MHSLTVNGLHFLGAAAGFLLIWWLASSPRHSRLLWPFTLAWGAVMAAFIFMNTHPLMEFAFWDFRKCYWLAGHLVLEGPSALAGAYNNETLVFVNLPIVAYLFAPFGLMAATPAAIVITLLGLATVVWIWRMLVRMYGLDARDSALLAFALCVFGPLIYSFKVGNTSHFILALLIGGLAAVRSGKGFAAGALFGVAAVIKPALVLVGVVYFLRGRWSVVAGGAAVIAGSITLSLLIFGWDMHVLWYDTSIRPFAGNTVAAYANQTLAGMAARFDTGGPYGHDYSVHILTAAGRLLTQGLTVVLGAGLLLAVWRSGRLFRPNAGDVEIEILIAIALAMTISSLSWVHYHVWLIPALVLIWTVSKPASPGAAMRWPVVVSFGLLMGTAFVSHSMTLGRFGPFANLVTSHWLWGTLILLGLLAYWRARADFVTPTDEIPEKTGSKY